MTFRYTTLYVSDVKKTLAFYEKAFAGARTSPTCAIRRACWSPSFRATEAYLMSMPSSSFMRSIFSSHWALMLARMAFDLSCSDSSRISS